VLAVAIGLLFVLAIAVSILAVVALPNLRNGSRLLTPDGERALEQARQKPVAAAEQTKRGVAGTWRGLVIARRSTSRAWAPVSERLHEVMDRLETRERPAAALRTGEIPIRDVSAPAGAPLPDSGPPTQSLRVRHTGEPEPKPEPKAEPKAEKTPIRHAQPSGPLRQRFDVAAIVGKRGPIGRPRPVPPVSGPIPVDQRNAPAEPGEDRVIDLRAEEHEVGSAAARHAR
jgi:hypothetical protein